MRIQLDQIDTDQFNIQERQHDLLGPIVLIGPTKSKHGWSDEELHLRSLLCRPDGTIICSGFPKFLNFGERQDLDEITREAILSEHPTYFPEKMDGSLIIRSVIDGHVCFRTRGSHHLGEFEEQVMRLVVDKYPRLNDPDYLPDVTCLFEYTSPNNRIIVPYEESELTFLGQMHYQEGRTPWFIGNPDLIRQVCEETGVRQLKFHSLPSDMASLKNEIVGWQNSEGIVVWCDLPGGMHLAKIKAAEYVRLHSIKYRLSDSKLQMLCWFRGLYSHEALRNELYSLGVDWESMSFVIPAFEEFLERKERYTKMVSDFLQEVEARGIPAQTNRKWIALDLKAFVASLDVEASERRSLFNVGIRYCTGDRDYVPQALDALILGISVGRLKSYGLEAHALSESLVMKAGEE